MSQNQNDGWSLQLASRLCQISWQDLPNRTRDSACRRLLHAIGVSLAHGDLPASRTAWRALGHSRGDSFGFGQGRRIAAEDAAFINGTIGHGSLLEDCGPGGLREGSHPGTFVIPAALALAEEIDTGGPALLTAMVIGYEAVSRIGFAGPVEIVQRRFRPLGAMGSFGSAAACASLLGASPEQMAAAIGIAAVLASGTTQGIFEGTMDAYFEAAFAARNGITAARLALAGATTPREALEGEFGFFRTFGGVQGTLDELLREREVYGIERVGTKRFAACLQNQKTIALIVDGLERPLRPDEISAVTVTRPAAGTHGLNSPGVSRTAPFPNMLAAQMSARFTAAAAMLGYPVDSPDFFAQHHADPEIVALTAKIDLRPASDDAVGIEIRLTDGRTIILRDDGESVLFPTPEMMESRFIVRTGRRLTDQAAIALCERIKTIAGEEKVRTLTEAISYQLNGRDDG